MYRTPPETRLRKRLNDLNQSNNRRDSSRTFTCNNFEQPTGRNVVQNSSVFLNEAVSMENTADRNSRQTSSNFNGFEFMENPANRNNTQKLPSALHQLNSNPRPKSINNPCVPVQSMEQNNSGVNIRSSSSFPTNVNQQRLLAQPLHFNADRDINVVQNRRATSENQISTNPVVNVHPLQSQSLKSFSNHPDNDNSRAKLLRNGVVCERSNRSTKTSSSIAARKRLEIQLTFERRRQENEKRILDLEEALELARVEEDDQNSVYEIIDEISKSDIVDKNQHIRNWLDDLNEGGDNENCHYTQRDAARVPVRQPNDSLQVQDTHHVNHNRDVLFNENKFNSIGVQSQQQIQDMNYWFARQTISKDLPYFSGDPLEWPQFIGQFRSSSKLCNLSPIENQLRLQKSLKGKAKEAVQSLLILPENIERVIHILESRFGRAEYVIHLLLEKVRQFPVVQENKLDTFIAFFDTFSNLIYTLEVYEQIDHIRNPFLFREVLNKLPMGQRMSFVQYQADHISDDPPITILHRWLDRKVNAASYLLTPSSSDEKNKSGKQSKVKDMTFTTVENSIISTNKSKCFLCNESNHLLFFCNKFKKIDIDKRWEIVTKNKICISCLRAKHNVKFCKSRKMCSFQNCTLPHHPLLHKTQTQSQNSQDEAKVETNCHIHEPNEVLLKIIPVELIGSSSVLRTFALLDDASTVSLIEKDVADQLNLDGPNNPLQIKWTNNQCNFENDSRTVSLTIKGINNNNKFILRRVKTMSNLSLPIQSVDVDKMISEYPYMSKYCDLSYTNAKPTILIGQDNWPVISSRSVISGYWNGPTVSKTLLGNVVHGNIFRETGSRIEKVFCHVYDNGSKNDCDDLTVLQNIIKEQWNFDMSGISSSQELGLSVEDKRSIAILNSTIRRVCENRFESGLLWKNNDDVLPESYSNALSRLHNLEWKMDKNSNYAKTYCEKMTEYIDKGYLKKVEDLNVESQRIWYLPHFGVVNPNKPNKLRIVFDAAAKSHGRSLNDFLLTGPDFYKSLPAILMNFRKHKIVFVADIKEMFLQVNIRESDRCAQRILWRGTNRDKPPDIYELQVVFFGATCSPCIAQEVKNANARELMKDYPKACSEVLECHYMDDYLGGSDNVEDAKKLIQEVITVHSKGGFSICNWISNSKEVLLSIDETLRAKMDDVILDSKNSEERILGMWWNFVDDSFSYKLKFNKIKPEILSLNRTPTKREVLKIIMSVFDPLGLISNFLIIGKILMQNIWQSGVNWDDPISDVDFHVWKSWCSCFKNISEIKIPRLMTSFQISNCLSVQLHIFCDASDSAYAAVAYLRFESASGIECILINAKARVAPLKSTSIPRLELQGALIGARLGANLKNILKVNIDEYFYWCDSKTVLFWIKSNNKRFKVYVSQRVGEIHELSNPAQWKYIPSKLNVADDATKFKPLDYSSNSEWLYGPRFLYKNCEEWPKENLISNENIDTGEELKIGFILTITNVSYPVIPDPKRFSSWTRLLRSTAWVMRAVKIFKNNLVHKANSKSNYSSNICSINELNVDEVLEAERILLRQSQLNAFKNDINMLKSGTELSSNSSLKQFKCFIDDQNLVRIQGRLGNANLDFETKHPMVLSPKDDITKLIIHQFHVKNNHLGTETVINDIRQKYWIFNLRSSVKGIAHQCQKCKNMKAKPLVQIMGQLPNCRVQPSLRPFAKCGVDYFGPYKILVNRHTEKRYGVLFTCMNVRAVHIEIANDLSCSAFIHVLRQFAARRGYPDELFSDNGSNFRRANTEIEDSLNDWPHDQIKNYCTTRNCRWTFNPPAAPHMGGVWERQIQSFKKHLDNILLDRCPKEFVLRTLFYEIEDIINNRPITFNSNNIDDDLPLTPNHFLKGFNRINPEICKADDRDIRLLSHWRAVQRLTDIFWSKWSKDFIPNLIISKKWNKENINVSIDDIVLMVDNDSPRNSWPIGKIVKTYPAKDGFIRIVDVQTKSGVFRRPISKIIKLDIFKD